MITLPAYNIIIDIETLSTAPNAVILSIGAVAVDVNELRILSHFYSPINPDQSALGRKVDEGVMAWWENKVDPQTRREAFCGTSALSTVLRQLRDWMKKVKGADGAIGVWGNGSAFDNVILQSAYNACGIPTAWHYRYDRCYRTLASFYPDIKPAVPNEQPHHAFHDAMYEARHFLQIIEQLKIQDFALHNELGSIYRM